MKLLILGDVNSVHIQKWSINLASKDILIGIFSLSEVAVNWFENSEYIEVLSHGGIKDNATFHKPLISKIKYLKVLPALKKAIRSFEPDIIHAHYASSYGLIGALSGFHPFFLSVWGNDVFDFPNEGVLNREILKYNLRNADRVFSTSYTMEKETKKYTAKNVEVIPFGVDIEIFRAELKDESTRSDGILIGTIKTMEKEYAIHDLIMAFSIVRKKNLSKDLKLLIVGSGTLEHELKKLSKDLSLDHVITFTGFIQPMDIPKYHNMIDIFVCLSVRESFGVAVVEAMACMKPVVVSNADGLPEVVDDGDTGYVVPISDPEAAANAIDKLVRDEELQKRLGKNARKKVELEYDIINCVSKMRDAYSQVSESTDTYGG